VPLPAARQTPQLGGLCDLGDAMYGTLVNMTGDDESSAAVELGAQYRQFVRQ
jgi:hypothetical protein